jgi:hypothetical protein
MKNHFTESGEVTFFSSQPFISIQRITYRINRDLLLSIKLFGKAPARFIKNQLLEVCQIEPSYFPLLIR